MQHKHILNTFQTSSAQRHGFSHGPPYPCSKPCSSTIQQSHKFPTLNQQTEFHTIYNWFWEANSLLFMFAYQIRNPVHCWRPNPFSLAGVPAIPSFLSFFFLRESPPHINFNCNCGSPRHLPTYQSCGSPRLFWDCTQISSKFDKQWWREQFAFYHHSSRHISSQNISSHFITFHHLNSILSPL